MKLTYSRAESKDNNRYCVYRLTDNGLSPKAQAGDEIQIDTRAEIKSGDMVAVFVNGETLLRQYHKKGTETIFNASQPDYEPIIAENFKHCYGYIGC